MMTEKFISNDLHLNNSYFSCSSPLHTFLTDSERLKAWATDALGYWRLERRFFVIRARQDWRGMPDSVPYIQWKINLYAIDPQIIKYVA